MQRRHKLAVQNNSLLCAVIQPDLGVYIIIRQRSTQSFPSLKIFGVHVHTVAIAHALRYSAKVPSLNQILPCVFENIHIDQMKLMLIRDYTIFNLFLKDTSLVLYRDLKPQIAFRK